MELSRQMLLLTAENYGSYYLHITKLIFLIYCLHEFDQYTNISNTIILARNSYG